MRQPCATSPPSRGIASRSRTARAGPVAQTSRGDQAIAVTSEVASSRRGERGQPDRVLDLLGDVADAGADPV